MASNPGLICDISSFSSNPGLICDISSFSSKPGLICDISSFSCRVALDRAEILLSKDHSMSRLDNVWGTGGGCKPVKMLIKKVRVI